MSEINYYRGDSYVIQFVIWTNKAAGTALDITGKTFKFTVNKTKDPTGTDSQLFQVEGVITDAAAGVVTFEPTVSDTDKTPGKYWYDIQMTTSSKPRTIIKDKFNLLQDITK